MAWLMCDHWTMCENYLAVIQWLHKSSSFQMHKTGLKQSDNPPTVRNTLLLPSCFWGSGFDHQCQHWGKKALGVIRHISRAESIGVCCVQEVRLKGASLILLTSKEHMYSSVVRVNMSLAEKRMIELCDRIIKLR